MTVTINGTTGVAGVDGTASTPAIQGNDTNTGIFFPAADTIAFAEGGAEVARFDSSGNLGIGTSSPNIASGFTNFVVSDTDNGGIVYVDRAGGARGYFYANGTSSVVLGNTSSIPLVFNTADTERMRIDSSGNLLVGTTTTNPGQNNTTIGTALSNNGRFFINNASGDNILGRNSDGTLLSIRRSGNEVGAINVTSSSTSYVTSSDYRLKYNVAPMTNALSKVALLKPCTYTWKSTGEAGQGFIAHELAEVMPDCVTGEKDAVETYIDEEGVEQTRPKYQGIDTSFLVATLTAAIQEQQAIITDLKARIETLEAK